MKTSNFFVSALIIGSVTWSLTPTVEAESTTTRQKSRSSSSFESEQNIDITIDSDGDTTSKVEIKLPEKPVEPTPPPTPNLQVTITTPTPPPTPEPTPLAPEPPKLEIKIESNGQVKGQTTTTHQSTTINQTSYHNQATTKTKTEPSKINNNQAKREFTNEYKNYIVSEPKKLFGVFPVLINKKISWENNHTSEHYTTNWDKFVDALCK